MFCIFYFMKWSVFTDSPLTLATTALFFIDECHHVQCSLFVGYPRHLAWVTRHAAEISLNITKQLFGLDTKISCISPYGARNILRVFVSYFGTFRFSCHLTLSVGRGYCSFWFSRKPCIARLVQLGLTLEEINTFKNKMPSTIILVLVIVLKGQIFYYFS